MQKALVWLHVLDKPGLARTNLVVRLAWVYSPHLHDGEVTSTSVVQSILLNGLGALVQLNKMGGRQPARVR